MSMQTAAHHLLRRWRSVPLPNLSQGSTLTIRSTVAAPLTRVFIQPEWRDNGHIHLTQIFSQAIPLEKQAKVQMKISQQEERMTSLGRNEKHISVILSADDTPSETEHVDDSHHHQFDVGNIDAKAFHKPIDKVILDDGTIHPDAAEYAPPPSGLRRVEYHDGCAHITKDPSSSSLTPQHQKQQSRQPEQPDHEDEQEEELPGTYLKVMVPEKVNLFCDLQSGGGSIVISSKIEGDVALSTSNGNIKVSKLRGHKIELQQQSFDTENGHGEIYCKDLLEAQSLTIHTTGRLRAKQVHGKNVKIFVSKEGKHSSHRVNLQDDDDEGSLVDVGALFVSGGGSGASIHVKGGQEGGGHSTLTRRAVRVKSHHGPLEVMTEALTRPTDIDPYTGRTYPLVELGGVNGNCEVTIQDTAVPDDYDKKESGPLGWTSCAVHVDSLLSDSVSLITCDRGDISLTLDRKVESDLRLLSTSNEKCLVEVGALLAEEEDPERVLQVIRNLPQGPAKLKGQQRLSIETTAFTSRSSQVLKLEEMGVTYADGWVENKSHEPDSRFDRRLRGEGKIRLDGAAAQALQSFSKPQTDDEQTPEHSACPRPLVAVASTERISVETVSWIGAIARRYGMDESNRGIGRTAAKRGRPIVPRTE